MPGITKHICMQYPVRDDKETLGYSTEALILPPTIFRIILDTPKMLDNARVMFGVKGHLLSALKQCFMLYRAHDGIFDIAIYPTPRLRPLSTTNPAMCFVGQAPV